MEGTPRLVQVGALYVETAAKKMHAWVHFDRNGPHLLNSGAKAVERLE